MRLRWLGLWGLLFAVGCSRSFTAPPEKPQVPDPLRASPGWLGPVPNQVVGFALSGGSHHYNVWTSIDGGPDCGTARVDGGGWEYRACLRPFLQDVVEVDDADGGHLQIPVSIGPAFSPQIPPVSQQGCTVASFGVFGGLVPYSIAQLEGDLPGSCDGGAGLSILPSDTPSVVNYLVPPWNPDGGNVYLVQVRDGVGAASNPPPTGSAYSFTLTVLPPPAALQPLAALSPGVVSPGQALQLQFAPADRTVEFAFADHGNSSGASLGGRGAYVAGKNANTVDHLLLTDAEHGQTADLWIQVGSPSLPNPLFSVQQALSGDLNGDGRSDLLVFADQGGTSVAEALVVFGGASGPSLQPSVYLPTEDAFGKLQAQALMDANGDGRADLVLARYPPQTNTGGGGGGFSVCPNGMPAWCDASGQPNPSYAGAYCNVSGSQVFCGGTVYDPTGQHIGYAPGTLLADGGIGIFADDAGIFCSSLDGGGYGGSYRCDVGTARTASGNTLASPGWDCGDAGCISSFDHTRCNNLPDGGLGCQLPEYFDGGFVFQIGCALTGPGSLSCGPVSCTDDHLGGWNCGPAGCTPDGQGDWYCVVGGCPQLAPATFETCSPTATAFQCESCTVSGAAPADGGSALASGHAEVLLSLVGGGFQPSGAIPGTEGELPGLIAPGQVLTGSGARVQALNQGGALGWQPDGQLNLPDAGFSAAEVRVLHLADGSAWGAFVVRMAGGQSGANVYVGGGVVQSGGGLSVPLSIALPQGWRRSGILSAVPFAGLDGESLLTLDFARSGLLVLDPPGGACDLAPALTSFAALQLDPSRIQGLTALPELHALAVASAPTSGSPVGATWTLVRRPDPGSCALAAEPWTAVGLALDASTPGLSGDIEGLASGDFNGDGLPDLAVAVPGVIDFYYGQIGGLLAQGERYDLPGPVGSLSAERRGDGGLIVGLEALTGAVRVMSCAQNRVGDAGPTSSLAYAATWPAQGDELATLLRGGELWVLHGSASGVSLSRYADPLDAGSALGLPEVVALPPGAWGIANFAQRAIADPSSSSAAWLVLAQQASYADGGADPQVLAVHLDALADGGVDQSLAGPLDLSGGRLSDFQALPDGGLEMLVATPGGLAIVDAQGGAQQLAPPTPFITDCSSDTPALFVSGTSYLVLKGVDGTPADGGGACQPGSTASCCRPRDRAEVWIYDRAAGTIAQAGSAGAGDKAMRAFPGTLPDGGLEILALGVGAPGLVAFYPTGSGWSQEAELTVAPPFVDEVAYPCSDGRPRHVVSQLSPASLQVIAR